MATSLKIDDALKGRIEHPALARDQSAHWIMREAIRQYVDREEAGESFRQDALSARAAYRETVLHATSHETDVWLAKLEARDDAQPPACHV